MTRITFATLVCLAFASCGCGGGGGAGSSPPTAAKVTGQVLGPNGVLASATIARVKSQATNVGSGVTVSLATVDDTGQLYTAYPGATAITNQQGQYEIAFPTGVAPSPSVCVLTGSISSPTGLNVVTGTVADIRPATTAATNLMFGQARSSGRAISSLDLATVATFMRMAIQTGIGAETGSIFPIMVAAATTAIQGDTVTMSALNVAVPPAPVLSNLLPSSATVGTSKNVTITGTNFTSDATVGVSGSGVSVSNVNVVSATQITATFTITAGATSGARNVTVATVSGASNAVPFTLNPSSTQSNVSFTIEGIQ